MSHTAADALRTTYCVVQMGSKLARFACGTNRSVFAAAFCEIAGVNNPPVVTKAPAPALVFKNALRSITLSPCSRLSRPRPHHFATYFGGLHTACGGRARTLTRPTAEVGLGAKGMPSLLGRE